jgi:hypothetical protein
MFSVRDRLDVSRLPAIHVDTTNLSTGNHVVLTADGRQQREALKLAASRAGLTQGGLARLLGVKRQSVDQYFRGKRPLSLEMFIRLVGLCRGSVVLHLPDAP